MEKVEGKEGLKEFYKRNKEYLPVVIILPTLLGALIQLVQLIIISPTFYKFFSLTQSIIDGSYILFQLLLIIVTVNLYNNFANGDEYNFFVSKIYKRGNTKQKSGRLFWRLLIINFMFLIGLVHFQDLIIDFKWPSLRTSIWYLILSFIAGLFVSRKRTKLYLQELLELHNKRKEPKRNNSRLYIGLGYITTFTIVFLFNVTFINKIPKSEFNNTYIVNKITNDYALEDAKILFYSDTYIIMNLQNRDCIWKKGIFKTDNYFNPSKDLIMDKELIWKKTK